MKFILPSICLSACILGIICLFIVIVHNKFRLYPKILTISIIMSCTLAIFLWSFYQGDIPLRPNANLALLSAPIYFVPGALLYLYIKSVIGVNKEFNWWYLIHFVPFAINVLILIPYFSQPWEIRQQIMLDMINGKSTDISFNVVSAKFEIFAKLVLWFAYFIICCRLLILHARKHPDWVKNHQRLWHWLTGITIIDGIAILFYLLILLFGYDPKSYSLTLVIPPVFLLYTSVLILLFSPKVLYGTKLVQPLKSSEPTSKPLELPSSQISTYKVEIESYIQSSRVYLKKNYSIKQLSEELDIPTHHLSYVINSEMGMNFQSYINKFRVLYIIDNFEKEEWVQYSLEGIGDEAGFNSRNTFFKAFKTVTGRTPSQGLKNKDQN